MNKLMSTLLLIAKAMRRVMRRALRINPVRSLLKNLRSFLWRRRFKKALVKTYDHYPRIGETISLYLRHRYVRKMIVYKLDKQHKCGKPRAERIFAMCHD